MCYPEWCLHASLFFNRERGGGGGGRLFWFVFFFCDNTSSAHGSLNFLVPVWVTYGSICVISCVQLADSLFCIAKTLTLDIARTLCNQFVFLPAILILVIGTMDFYYHCIDPPTHPPLSVTLTLAWGCKVSACKAKPVGFNLSHTFQLTRMKFDLILMQFKLRILILVLNEI